MRPITIDDIKAVIEQNPDRRNQVPFRYFNCSGSEPTPSCVFGHIIAYVGGDVTSVTGQTEDIGNMPYLFDSGATCRLAAIIQLTGWTWQEAWEYATKRASRG